jgi:hypothetical protein
LTELIVEAPFLLPSALTVTMSDCVTRGAVTLVTVTVRQPFTFQLSLFGTGPVTLIESVQGVFN